jgi:hypothetical protein
LLAIPADHPEEPLDGIRARIHAWYRAQQKPVTEWKGEDGARSVIADARAYTEQR